ncbi:MAG: hypothetical protein LEGION0398_MBIBDBAK_00016 [Legionellaceae bacterium]
MKETSNSINPTKNVILMLGIDKTTHNSAIGIATKLKEKNGKEYEIRLLKENCLNGLKKEDISEITLVGHTDEKQDKTNSVMKKTYGKNNDREITDNDQKAEKGFNAKEFVNYFDTQVSNANFDKKDIKVLRCFGCELGFVDLFHGNTVPLAQELVNEFVLKDYDLKLYAFAFDNNHGENIQALRLVIAEDGKAEYYGFAQKNKNIMNMESRIADTKDEIEKIKTKIKEVEINDPFRLKHGFSYLLPKLTTKIVKEEKLKNLCGFNIELREKEKELKKKDKEYNDLKIVLFKYGGNPIELIDEEKNCFKAETKGNTIDYPEKKIDEKIINSDENIPKVIPIQEDKECRNSKRYSSMESLFNNKAINEKNNTENEAIFKNNMK